MIKYNTFQDAFLGLNRYILRSPQYNTTSRIGRVYEIQSLSYSVSNLKSFKFEDESIGRINYEYASDFFSWMATGGTDVKMLADKYPNVSNFLNKPKSELLPDNFNTFYGPRIKYQEPFIINELKTNPDTRRAVISIIDKEDLLLLDKDETLEFPCADSATFSIRDNKLNIHLHMRSQNIGQVLKLDMYLWGKYTCHLADILGVEVGSFSSSIVSAHVFEKDKSYLEEILDRIAEKATQ